MRLTRALLIAGVAAALSPALAGIASALNPASAAAATRTCGDPRSRPWCDPHLSPAHRARLLMAALNEADKVSLLEGDDLGGVAGGADQHTGTANGIARVGIPTIHFTDGTAGIRQGAATALPAALAVAASFDPRLARLDGAVLGTEARDKGNDVLYGPTLTIMRTPLGGRTFQSFGEDPLLQSSLGAAEIGGVQSRGVIANANIMAANTQEGYSPKADQSRPGQPLGPGATAGSRFTDDAVVAERALREVYLPPFEAAVKTANVGTVMCAYNRVNGAYSCESHHLLDDVLHGWGFGGFTLSDYGAAHSTIASLGNGLDFEPWPPGGPYSPAKVGPALASGQVAPRLIDAHVQNYLRTLFAFGVFDRPPYGNDPAAIHVGADGRIAERIAESAVTLLVNRRGALPLNPRGLRSLAIIGAGADSFITGGGSSNVTPLSVTTPAQAISRRVGPHVRVRTYGGSDPARAAAIARASGVAIVIAPNYQTEGVDRRCLTLECPPAFGNEDALISSVSRANRRTIVVLETGGPVLTPWRSRVAGLLEAWYPGEQGGSAIARVLFGDTDPSGRLPVSFPATESGTPTAGDPLSYPGVADRTVYKEGVLVGYRWYDAHHVAPAFPFGFGLSYTHFAYGPLRVTAVRTRAAVARLSLPIANDGGRPGVEVPQLYVHIPPPGRGVSEPPWQLRGFRRVSLGSGARATVTFTLTARDLAFWSAHKPSWRVGPGCYPVFVGSSSRTARRTGAIAVGTARCPGAAAHIGLPSAEAAARSLL